MFLVTYKVSVQDVVGSANKNTDDWGIQGYEFIKFNPFVLPKNPGFKIVKSRQRDIMGEFIKHIKNFPGPSQYETGGNFLPRQKHSIYKLNRITTFAEEAKRNEKSPEPGRYHKELKTKPPGCFKLKEERAGFLEQAIADGLSSPSHYEAAKLEKYKMPREINWTIKASKKKRFEKIEQNNSPSPMTYKNDEAFDKLTHKNRSFVVPKQKMINYFERVIKNKSGIPSVGQYDIPKADAFITKGARTSYR